MADARTLEWDASPSRLSWSSRLLAAVAYVGAGAFIVAVLPIQRPFVLKHARVALTIHLLRATLVIVVLLGLAAVRGSPEPNQLLRIAVALGLTLTAGIPWAPGLERSVITPALVAAAATWTLSLAGLAIALSGRTADVRAFLHADWPDRQGTPPDKPDRMTERPRDEARLLWEQRLDRMWHAAAVARAERQRCTRITELQEQIRGAHARIAHLRHLLEIGEVSAGQFDQAQRDLQGYASELERELAALTQRLPLARPTPQPPAALTTLPVADLVMLSIVDPSGTPVFTWGHFPIDEALTAGMMSALDALAEEMFGAPVQKTALAEGAVVSVVRGERTRLVAWFDGDPSPNQLRTLQGFLAEFERENAAVLASLPVDPSRIVAPPLLLGSQTHS